jgi:hypothetical protein
MSQLLHLADVICVAFGMRPRVTECERRVFASDDNNQRSEHNEVSEHLRLAGQSMPATQGPRSGVRAAADAQCVNEYMSGTVGVLSAFR